MNQNPLRNEFGLIATYIFSLSAVLKSKLKLNERTSLYVCWGVIKKKKKKKKLSNSDLL